MSHAYYMNELFNPSQQHRAIKEAKKALRKLDYDALLVSGGVSGMFGAILANNLKKGLVVARKSGVFTHSSYAVEGLEKDQKLVFVDDLIGTGETIKHCCRLAKDSGKRPKIVGAWLYNDGALRSAEILQVRYGIVS